MLEEGAVLAGDEGLHHVPGHALVGRQPPPLVEERADRAPLAVEDLAGQRGAVVRDAAQVRQIAQEGEVEGQRCADSPEEEERRHQQRDARDTRPVRSHGTH